jgi:predicted nucleic acid-binding protein
MTVTPRPLVLLDASVLYPALLRNILMYLALRDLFRPFWSERIQDEWTRALMRERPDLPAASILRTRRLMDEHVEGASVRGFDDLIDTINLPDKDDRHVLAAAIHCGASLIITANLKDFPSQSLLAYGIEPQHPDAFILKLFKTAPDEVVVALRELRQDLRKPPLTAADLLAAMVRQDLRASADALAPLTSAL